MASTGHSATQSVQSMHSSGSITRKFGPSRKQSTGHTSTQSVYLQRIQDSVTTWVMGNAPGRGKPSILGDQRINTAAEVLWLAVSTSTSAPSVRERANGSV